MNIHWCLFRHPSINGLMLEFACTCSVERVPDAGETLPQLWPVVSFHFGRQQLHAGHTHGQSINSSVAARIVGF